MRPSLSLRRVPRGEQQDALLSPCGGRAVTPVGLPSRASGGRVLTEATASPTTWRCTHSPLLHCHHLPVPTGELPERVLENRGRCVCHEPSVSFHHLRSRFARCFGL